MEENQAVPSTAIVPTDSQQRELAVQTLTALEPEVQDALVLWAVDMLAIRQSRRSSVRKAIQAISATKRRKVLWPIFQALWDRMNELGWAVKLAVGVAAVVAVALPGQGAGIAAFGGAIGVPLWAVFGAGGAFLGAIVDAAKGRCPSGS